MMKMNFRTYFLTWNPKKFDWSFEEQWDSAVKGYIPIIGWSVGNTKRIKIGDRIFMTKLGHNVGKKGIFLSGWVTELPFESASWNEKSDNQSIVYVDFEIDVFLHPYNDDLLDPQLVSNSFDWYPQRSGISIPDDIAQKLEIAWQSHITNHSGLDIASQTTLQLTKETYQEGSKILISNYRYERDPRAREACIRHYGVQCQVCKFDFEEQFGEIGRGYIQVHHKTPISERDGVYHIDPITDLVPVCPNCHAMIHRVSPPYTIEELQAILKEKKDNMSQ